MLSKFALLFRLRLILLQSLMPLVAVVPAMLTTQVAYADDDDDDDDDFGDEEEDEEEEEESSDTDPQPPVTAGGMYTKKTYPVAELDRTLMLIGGMFEVRAGMDIDVSDKTAFDTWRGKLDIRYGLQDNLELQLNTDVLLTGARAVGTQIATVAFGAETAISFEFINFRALVEIPVTAGPTDPSLSETGLNLVIGFPFRYKLKPKMALIALDRLMAIDLTGGDPDLTVGVAYVIQLLPNVAGLLRGEVTIPNFDTTQMRIPATAAIQFSPNNKFDIGGEFTFKNFKPAQGEEKSKGPFDERSLLLYAQARL